MYAMPFVPIPWGRHLFREKVGNSTLDDLEIAFEGHKFQHLGAVPTVPNQPRQGWSLVTCKWWWIGGGFQGREIFPESKNFRKKFSFCFLEVMGFNLTQHGWNGVWWDFQWLKLAHQRIIGKICWIFLKDERVRHVWDSWINFLELKEKVDDSGCRKPGRLKQVVM